MEKYAYGTDQIPVRVRANRTVTALSITLVDRILVLTSPSKTHCIHFSYDSIFRSIPINRNESGTYRRLNGDEN